MLGTKIDELKAEGSSFARDNAILRNKIQQEIIDGAHVLCSTLSGSAHDMFKNLNVEFETVIIDEAAQCIELSALIPLKYGCVKCILVGDPKQLPPTVLSREAAKFGYEQSLFVRMQTLHPNDVNLLDTQYRMHPEISRFPSAQFYDGKLVDGAGMLAIRQKPWHVSSILGPYRFFNVRGVQNTGARGHSYINQHEVNVAMQLYERLRLDFGSYDVRKKVGIITPYKAQLKELKLKFSHRYGEEILDNIDFNTTDAFQGRESEIIIFSCVRAKAVGGIGFLDDIRRMNVGITRAKSSLWLLGDANALKQGEFWGKLVDDARQRNLFTDGDVLGLLNQPVPRDVQLIKDGGAADGQNSRITDVTDVPDVEMGGMDEAPTPMQPKASVQQERKNSIADTTNKSKSTPPAPPADLMIPSNAGNGRDAKPGKRQHSISPKDELPNKRVCLMAS